MKKILLLFLTLITLNVASQDTLSYEKQVNPFTNKLYTFHNNVAKLNLDISDNIIILNELIILLYNL